MISPDLLANNKISSRPEAGTQRSNTELDTYDNPDHTSIARGAIRASSQRTSRHAWKIPIDKVSPEERDRRILLDPMERILEQAGANTHSDPHITRELIKKYRDKGDLDAKERLVTENIRFVIFIAKEGWKKLKAVNGTASMQFSDLVQEGTIGLIRAVEKYDPAHESQAQFSSYAGYAIRKAISRAIDDKGATIRIPVHVGNEVNRTRKRIRAFETEKQRTATTTNLTEENTSHPSPLESAVFDEEGFLLGDISEATMARLEREFQQATSNYLNDPYGSWARIETLRRPRSLRHVEASNEEQLIDQTIADPAELGERKVAKKELIDVLNLLTDTEKVVLALRYGLVTEDRLTLDGVGRVINRTRERVRQIENQTLKKIQLLHEAQCLRADTADVLSRGDNEQIDTHKTATLRDTIYPVRTRKDNSEDISWPYKTSYKTIEKTAMVQSKDRTEEEVLAYLNEQFFALKKFDKNGDASDIDIKLLKEIIEVLEKMYDTAKKFFDEGGHHRNKQIQLLKEMDILYGIIEGKDFSTEERVTPLHITRVVIAKRYSQYKTVSLQ